MNSSIIREFTLPLPPLTEQQRIVAEVEHHLSIVQELETTLTANLTRAERLRQAILRQAFAGQLVPQDPADEPASALLARIRAGRNARSSVGSRLGAVTARPGSDAADSRLFEQMPLGLRE